MVTLAFTDVEGSTRLLQELGAAGYAAALAEHRRLVREAFAARGGIEVDTQGDAFFYVFRDAGAAVAAAAAANEALAAGPIRVRMGLHTGTPLRTEEGYVGDDVHLGARIAAAGHGGQVLLSSATRALVEGEVLELGEHRLKDFAGPVRIFQLGSARFPPLKTISNTNLPRAASTFVGRERETAEVVDLVRRHRLVTLSGPGGSGKTRLALEAGRELVGDFKAGVFWVGLAGLRDPALVPETIGQLLGAKNGLAEHVGERELLLLLDNLEQVIDAARELATLLEACPNLHLLVTSRELLRIRGEAEYAVAPLSETDAVNLFCERAGAKADETVAELCRRLDQLPLAVELAAARSAVLSPAQILDRLGRRLDLLRGGRDAEARHQTLRTTIAWSYELLDEDGKDLFARLAVFDGGCTLEAAEATCDADLDTLQSLVQKSLVRHANERFWMLETIREYALEQLSDRARAESSERQARYFLELAERSAPGLEGEQQAEVLQALAQEAPNLRAAFALFATADARDESLRLAFALRFFWVKLGYLSEGRRIVEQLLAVAGEPTLARARTLATAALLASLQGDWRATARWAEEGRRLGLELGDPEVAAGCMLTLGRATLASADRTGALALFAEAALLASSTGDQNQTAMAAFNLGYAALEAGDLVAARAEFERSTAATDPYLVARAHAAAGSVALHAGDADQAANHLRESLQTLLQLGRYEDTAAWALELYAAALIDSDPSGAARLLGVAERMREELGLVQQGIELELHERTSAAARGALGDDPLVAAWSAGRASLPEDAIRDALGAVAPVS